MNISSKVIHCARCRKRAVLRRASGWKASDVDGATTYLCPFCSERAETQANREGNGSES
jgi:hypothetical protein